MNKVLRICEKRELLKIVKWYQGSSDPFLWNFLLSITSRVKDLLESFSAFLIFFLVPNRGFALLKSLEHFSSLMFYYNLWSFLRCWKVLLKETKVMAEELNYRINGLIVQSAHHTSMNDFEFLPHISQHWRCYWTTLRSNSITVHLNRLWSCHENFGLQMAQ